ncbi:hypothetical protein F7725_021113 [Dissostichus mawsoni]|uniref:serine--tRNA ligase n=1 Tax=Dissostichus mawsoni TaxID=36200 RepID=A0A7J5YF76_DISMA|nr:hypothetical protein F7725_021113 [Dissostichus mawsoni]
MATSIGMVSRVGATALTALKPITRHCSRQRIRVFIRCSHGARSSLYDHSVKGYSDLPELDMTEVCEQTEKVIANVENRKGELRGEDVRKIELQAVRTEISGLEQQKVQIGESVKALVAKSDKKSLSNLPEFNQALQKGREARKRLNQLYPKEMELDQEHYGRALRLPNSSHPDVSLTSSPEAMWSWGGAGLIRQRSYYLRGAGARLQTALQNFALDTLQRRGFVPMVVPDMLKGAVFEGCGMQPKSHRSQVYSLDPELFPDLNLAGTERSEWQVISWIMQTVCSSTCYRAETDTGRETWGLYRVHHFNKVEMFGVTADETGEESAQLLQEFISLQKEMFSALELHYRVLDMPTQELGLPAHRKYDIEAWMPGRDSYGEISSGSNCTDYQSRRLILYEREDGLLQYAHTVNATACAIPRTIIAILETHQTKPFLGLEVIEKPKYTPLKYIGPNQHNRPPRPAPKSR